MQMIMGRMIVGLVAALIITNLMASANAAAETWHQQTLITGTPVHGVHGLTFGPDGKLYVGSVMGQSIVAVDPTSGAMTEVVPAPQGEADDVAFGPNGHMAWTALNAGEVRVRDSSGGIRTVAENLNFANPVTFGPDGTLYAASLFGPDQLWAYDLEKGASQLVAENLGGLNAFEFGPDSLLYTPLPQRQAIATIDVETGGLAVIAEGVGNIVAVKFHPDGLLYGVSWDDGVVTRIDPVSGWTEPVARVTPPLDNLAIDDTGIIYVTRSADNGIIAVNPVSGASRIVTRSDLATPGGMAWSRRDGESQLLITDVFGYRFVDPDTGETTLLPFDMENGASSDADVREGLLALSYVRRGRVVLKEAGSGDVLHAWSDLNTPYGVLIESSGSVLVASYGEGTLRRLSLNTRDQHTTVANGLSGPVGLAWSNQGTHIFVAEAGADRVSRIDITNGKRDTVVSDLAQPESLAVMPDGRLVITEVGARRVVAVDMTSGDKTILADSLAVGGIISRTPQQVGMPTGIAVDTAGAVYVVTDANNGLIKLIKE